MDQRVRFLGWLCLCWFLGCRTPPTPPLPAPSSAPGDGALSAREVEELFSLLPPLSPVETPKPPALLPTNTPRPYQSTEQAGLAPLSTPARPPAIAVEALSLVRHSPDGPQDAAGEVSLVFSQPMVELAAIESTTARPATLTPEPTGQWAWLSPNLLKFFPDKNRFPMATEYTVEIPAGTKSALGGALAAPARFSFSTPAPVLLQHIPAEGEQRVSREPVVFLFFNQKVSPDAVLPFVSLAVSAHSPGKKPATSKSASPVALTLASTEQVATAKKSLARTKFLDSQWMALVPAEPLPEGARAVVTLAAGLPSAEGPKTTEHATSFSFETYGPFTVTEAGCGNKDEGCLPYSRWRFRLSNPLQSAYDSEKEDWVRVTPPVERLRVSSYRDEVEVSGSFQANTSYTLTLRAGVKSTFGQSLASDYTIKAKVNDYGPSLDGFLYDAMGVLYPQDTPFYSLQTSQVRAFTLSVYQVTPRDFGDYLATRRPEASKAVLPGRLVRRERVAVKDEFAPTEIELNDVLPSGRGSVIVVAEAAGKVPSKKKEALRHVAWIQYSRLAVQAWSDSQQVRAWVSDLGTGAPVEGAEVSLYPGTASARTDANGLVTLPLSETEAQLLLVKTNDDEMFLPRSDWPSSEEGESPWSSWPPPWKRSSQRHLAWYLASDRELYRRGEDVAFKGFVRVLEGDPDGNISFPQGKERDIACTLTDSRGRKLFSQSTQLSKLGGFSLQAKIPEDASLGGAYLSCRAGDNESDEGRAAISVREFRRPEFQVKVEAGEGPLFQGDTLSSTLSASYFNGGPLSNADTNWEISYRESQFQPPHQSRFHFGGLSAWHDPYQLPGEQSESGETDAAGVARLSTSLPQTSIPFAYTVLVAGRVQDLNQQAWRGSDSVLVHPSANYVGLRTRKFYASKGAPFVVDSLAVDLDGKPVVGRSIALRMELWDRRSDYDPAKNERRILERLACTATSAQEAVPCSFTPTHEGLYEITAEIRDEKGRLNTTIMYVSSYDVSSNEETRAVSLLADQEEYEIGDTATISLSTPRYPAEALIAVRRNGVSSLQRVSLQQSNTEIQVPITASDAPSIYVSAEIVGRQETPNKDESSLPEVWSAGVELRVSPEGQRLRVEVLPKDPIARPGSKSQIDVLVRDSKGQPITGAEVTLAVVDESVLALAGDYRFPDPLMEFYPYRNDTTETFQSRYDSSLLVRGMIWGHGSGSGSGGGIGGGVGEGSLGGAPGAIPLRDDFRPLALFADGLSTDAQGRASTPITLPDNLTRYRVMALASAPEPGRLGQGEATITATQPLMVRPSPPRFLRAGDSFSMPVLLQNQTPHALSVLVAMRAVGGRLDEPSGRRVTVPGNGRIEVLFSGAVADPGEVLAQVLAVSGKERDASLVRVRSYAPITLSSVAMYGALEESPVAVPLALPANAVPGLGGLEVGFSSSLLLGLSDATVSLSSYPYACSEQLSSKIIGIASLWDVLQTLHADDLPPESELRAMIARDLRVLASRQEDDGSVGLWTRGKDPFPFVSVNVAHALARAKRAGFAVDEEMLSRSLLYLQLLSKTAMSQKDSEASPLKSTDAVTMAYALYVRTLLGDTDAAAIAWLWSQPRESLPLEAVAFLLRAGAKEASLSAANKTGLARLLGAVTETAGAAHLNAAYSQEDGYLLFSSNARLDALTVDALSALEPSNPLLPKLVTGLLGRRQGGRWLTTQDNSFSLAGLRGYFDAQESTAPEATARAWLGESALGEVRFSGSVRSASSASFPLEEVRSDRLTLAREGSGRLYYRLGLSYAVPEVGSPSLDRGFHVERSYEALDKPEDVSRSRDGAWHIRAGARVQVRVRVVAPTLRYHAAIVDYLPAGLEAQDPSLSGTVYATRAPSGNVFERQFFYDDRVEAFQGVLYGGIYELVYTALATTRGGFVAPPAKAEEMYAPETFGRSEGVRVEIE